MAERRFHSEITADSTKFEAAMENAAAAALTDSQKIQSSFRAAFVQINQAAGDSIGKIRSTFTSLLDPLAGVRGAIAGAMSVAGMVLFARHAIDAAESLNKLSQRTGIAVEDLSALKFAADQSDLPIETLALGLKKMATTALEARDPNSEAARTFAEIGVNALDADKHVRPMLPLMLDMAEKFSRMADGGQKSALAVKAFGRSGDELIPFLNQGREGITRLMAEAERLGLILNSDTAAAAERASDNLKALKTVGSSLAVGMVNEVAPAMARITEAMREALKESGILAAAWVGLGGIAAESLGFGTKEAMEKARDLTREIAELNRALEQLKFTTLSPDALRREEGKIAAQITSKQAELNALRQQIEKERKDREKLNEAKGFLEQREKDRQAKEQFIAALKKESETFGASRSAQIAYAAAQAGAKLQTVEYAIALRREAAAWAEKLAAQQQAKDQSDEQIKRDNESKAATIAAIKAVIDSATAMEREAEAWQDTNDERKMAKLLQALVVAGMSEESEAYRLLEARLNAAAGALEHANELRQQSADREAALKALQQEISDLEFETAILTLNNRERERAIQLRKLAKAGAADTPQGAQLMDQFDEAQARARAMQRLQQQEQLLQLSVEREHQARQHVLAMEREHLDSLEQLGTISGMQKLQRLRQLRASEFAIELQAEEAKGRLIKDDEVAYQQHLDRMKALKEGYALDQKKLDGQIALESKRTLDTILDPIGQAVQTMVNGVLQGTQTMQQMVRNALLGVASQYLATMVKIGLEWIKTEILKTKATAAGEAARLAAVGYGGGATTAINASTATTSIGMSAWDAAAGVYASIAKIPVVGPFLAPAMAIAAAATVLSFIGKLFSAAGGFDVPRGMSPMTQLHGGEMVLPETYADVIRGLADRGGAGGERGMNVTLHVHALDSRGVERVLINNPKGLERGIENMVRNFGGIKSVVLRG